MVTIHSVIEYGTLNLAWTDIQCAVLDNEMRVLTERTIASAFMRPSANYWKEKKENEKVLPEYLALPYLKEYISPELIEKINSPVLYKAKNGRIVYWVDATILSDICDVWIKAKEAWVLNDTQTLMADKAYDLLKSFANVGIIALVDEVTGYEKVRKRWALQQLLEAFISKDLLPWQKRFPDAFYEQIFRLKWMEYDPKNIKRPGFIGGITNKYIYEQISPDVLRELKVKTPKSETGNYTARFHQSLTDDIWNPVLSAHLQQVIGIMKSSRNWEDFNNAFNRAFNKQLSLDIEYDEL